MRRVLVMLAATMLATGLWAAPGSAGGEQFTIRNDPDDSSSVLDLAKVGTRLTQRRLHVYLETHDSFSAADLNVQVDSYFLYKIDTERRGRADRFIYLYYYPPNGLFYCDVLARDGTRQGVREAFQDSFAGLSIIDCTIKRSWLDISKPERFAVEAWSVGTFVDRAPDVGTGRYPGL
jgi:hypothetical protein